MRKTHPTLGPWDKLPALYLQLELLPAPDRFRLRSQANRTFRKDATYVHANRKYRKSVVTIRKADHDG